MPTIKVVITTKVTYPKGERPEGFFDPDNWTVAHTRGEQVEVVVAKVKAEKI